MDNLIVGVDTYATLLEADEYVRKYYTEYDDLRVIWEVLTDQEKTSYLSSSLVQIEALVLEGKPFSKNQELQFPRINCYKPATRENPSFIPTEVKEAQVENALAILNSDCSSKSDEQMLMLQSLGIVKNTKYNKREMGEIGMGASLTGEEHKSVLESEDALKMLRAWY